MKLIGGTQMIVKQTTKGKIFLEEQKLFDNLIIYTQCDLQRDKQFNSESPKTEKMEIFGRSCQQ